MLKEMTAYDFYNNYEVEGFDSLGATCLIMPDEKFTVINPADMSSDGKMVEGLARHGDTACAILKEEYNVPIDMNNLPQSFEERAGHIKYVIMISYVIQDGFQFVSINVPDYITLYQVEQLEKVDEELKQIESLLKEKYGENSGKFLVGVTQDNFNPYNKRRNYDSIRLNNDFDGVEDFANGKVNDPIKSMLEYMKANNKVVDNIKNEFKQNIKVGSL